MVLVVLSATHRYFNGNVHFSSKKRWVRRMKGGILEDQTVSRWYAVFEMAEYYTREPRVTALYRYPRGVQDMKRSNSHVQ